MGHDRLSMYGIAKDVGRPELREIIGQLQARRLLVRSEGDYPTLAVTAGGRQLLQGRQSVTLPLPRTAYAGLCAGKRTQSGRFPGSADGIR